MQLRPTDTNKNLVPHWIFGLVQALLLIGLHQLEADKPSLWFYAVTSAWVVAWCIPVMAHLSLANAPNYKTLFKWLAIAGLAMVGLTCYTVWRAEPLDDILTRYTFPTEVFYPLSWFIFVACFIAQALVVTRWTKAQHQGTQPYTSHFVLVWKHALELFLGLVFAGIAYALLWLGHGLFSIIHINFLGDYLLSKYWFNVLFFCLTFAYSQYLLSRQTKAIESVRDFLLRLFSWMLPLVSALITVFLLLCVTQGFDLLWKTKFAGSLLIGTGLGLIFWINVCYRDGQNFTQNQKILRLSVYWSCLLLLPLACLSFYAIDLRVSAYGWTADRIISSLGAACLFLYGVGYSAAAIQARRHTALRTIQKTNLWMAFVVVGLIVLINSPILDPYKISVSSQINRLQAGDVDPERFDYSYLRFDSYRYGTQALTELAQGGSENDLGKNAAIIQNKASEALAANDRRTAQSTTKKALMERFKHYPTNTNIPASFQNQDWIKQFDDARFYPSSCYENNCTDIQVFWSTTPSKAQQVLFVQDEWGPGVLFEQDRQQQWRFVGKINNLCQPEQEQLRQGGSYQLTTQAVSAVVINHKTYIIEQNHESTCRD